MKGCSLAVITGNVTRDPELKYTNNGNALCEFSIAVNGFKKEDVSFFNIIAWNRGDKYKLAETCSKYISKGSQVQVIGKLKEDRWEDKETGKKRSRVHVVADEVVFLCKNEDTGTTSQNSQDSKYPADNEDDIPF